MISSTSVGSKRPARASWRSASARAATLSGKVARDLVVGVRRREELDLGRQLSGADPVGIAAAVPALVMLADERNRPGERLDRVEDALAERGVQAVDRLVFGGTLALGLEQDRLGYPELADVVEQRPERQVVLRARRKAACPAGIGGDGRDALRVVAGERVLLLEQVDHAEDQRLGRVELVAQPADPEQRAQPRQELDAVERFVEEVVGAGFEAADLALDVGERGQHDHRDEAGRARGLDPPADLEPVEARHHDVEEDRLRRLGGDRLERRQAVAREADLEALVREDRRQKLEVLGLIVDRQDPRRLSGWSRHRGHYLSTPPRR